jgi:putative chitinase
MNSITVAALLSTGVSPTQARKFAGPMAAAALRFGIDSPMQKAAFVAQAAHESDMFSELEESLWYTTAARIVAVFGNRAGSVGEAQAFVRSPERLANKVYSNRLGNGSEQSGDGWRYRGSGLFQLTGRRNFAAASVALGVPYLEMPNLVRQDPTHAALTAAWYWHATGCNAPASRGDIDSVTRKINGPAMLGREERAKLYRHALHANV